jgi:hypothetical protein
MSHCRHSLCPGRQLTHASAWYGWAVYARHFTQPSDFPSLTTLRMLHMQTDPWTVMYKAGVQGELSALQLAVDQMSALPCKMKTSEVRALGYMVQACRCLPPVHMCFTWQ